MDSENIIKSILLKLFNEGKSQVEAHEEISKSHSSYEVSENTVNKWFEAFKSEDCSLSSDFLTSPSQKLSDEYIADLINKNPDLTIAKLSKIAKCSNATMQSRINKLNNNSESINYLKKDGSKFSDEYLVELINNNPDLTIAKLSKLAKCSLKSIWTRINKLNRECKSVNYQKKDNYKFSDEYLIDLVDKNPGLNMTELARLAGTSQNTISRRIKQISSMGKNIKYTCKRNRGHRSGANTASNSRPTNEFLINLVNENPDLSIEKLAALANIPKSTMWNRIERINRNGEKVIYHKKDNKKFADEDLINLINKNPNLSMENLASLMDTSPTTIFNRIKQINDSGEINYCKKDNKKFTDDYLIDLVDSNPDLSLEKLGALTGSYPSTILSRIKNINNNGERIDYINKYSEGRTKFTDEFLTGLINKNPELNKKELAKLAGASTSTIYRHIKKINSDRERVKNISEKPEVKAKLTDEFLINLINENPELNMKELAKLADTSILTISNRIKKINTIGEKVKYISNCKLEN